MQRCENVAEPVENQGEGSIFRIEKLLSKQVTKRAGRRDRSRPALSVLLEVEPNRASVSSPPRKTSSFIHSTSNDASQIAPHARLRLPPDHPAKAQQARPEKEQTGRFGNYGRLRRGHAPSVEGQRRRIKRAGRTIEHPKDDVREIA